MEILTASSLRETARTLAQSAAVTREVSERTKAAISHPELRTAAIRRPLRAARAERVLLGALADNRELAVRLALTSLRLRIAAVSVLHPEIETDPEIKVLVDAVVGGGGARSALALRRVFRQRGAAKALSSVTPVLAELLAIRALTDRNPLNDETGWAMALGQAIDGDPLTGLSGASLSALDSGAGWASPVVMRTDDAVRFADRGSFLGFLGNITVLGTDGRILVQSLAGPDGVRRYVVMAPGMAAGLPRNDTPQDFVGAWQNLFRAQSPYTKAIGMAIGHFGIPDGADVALIGHSEGGLAVFNLAQDPDFTARFKVTHAIAVGSPVDSKRPTDPDTWVASVTNQHDLIPMLDGRGAGSVVDPHPDWYEVDYVEDSHGFPECHSIARYVRDLEHNMPEACQVIDDRLAAFHGPVLRTQGYQLHDRPTPPAGYPFLTVPTASADTSAGSVELPLICPDAAAAVFVFAAPARAAASLLAELPMARPVAVAPRRALVAVTVHEYRDTAIGSYRELNLVVAVHDLWSPDNVRVWTDLLRRPDRRHSGFHLVHHLVDTERAAAVSRTVHGREAQRAELFLDLVGGTGRVDAEAAGILTLGGRLGPGIPVAAPDWVLFSRSSGTTLRAGVDVQGATRLHPAHHVRLRLADLAEGSVAGAVRALGLSGARPLAVLTGRSHQTRHSAAVPVPGAELLPTSVPTPREER